MVLNRIVIVSHGSSLSGAERCLFETILAIKNIIPGVNIYCIFPQKGPIIDRCKDYIEESVIISHPWWVNYERNTIRKVTGFLKWLLTYSIADFRKYFRKIRPDLIITNTIKIPTGAIVAKTLRINHIWYIHEIDEKSDNYIFGKFLTCKIVSLLSIKILTNSKFTFNYYSRFINKRKLLTIYQPVLINTVPGDKIHQSDKTRLIMAGRFLESKGQIEAIKAFEILIENDNQFELTLIGADDSSFSKQVIQYVVDKKIKKIAIVSFTEDLTDYYCNADIALVCSATETFGRITIEAMKSGLPVIASDVGGNKELVVDGFNGYKYKKGNITDLVNKIILLKETETLNRLSKNAKEFAMRNFTLDKYSSDLKMVFDKL